MEPIVKSTTLKDVHSDIRGPLYFESLKMIERGEKVLRLNTGNPATFGFKLPESMRKALVENVDKAVAYCDFRGMKAAREAIAAYHVSKGVKGVTPDDVFIGNGVSEMASMATTVLVSPGDEVLVPSPSYSLWTNAVLIAGGKPVFYVCDEKQEWCPDFEDIKSKVTPKTKGIVIINPNNPTGALYPEEFLKKVVDLAREKNLLVLADEIYDRLVMDGYKHVALASLADDVPFVTFNGLSKSHVVCGFRCGWMAISGPKNLTEQFFQGMVQLTSMRLCGNALTQLVVPAALSDSAYTEEMINPGGRLYEQREATMREIAKIPGLSVVKNKGALYCFPKLDKERFNITSDKKFAMDLLHAKRILMVPGSGFDWPYNDHFRIVMLPEAHELAKAMQDLGDFLSTYRQED